MASIFVQIAAYRDPECVPTILDLFHKAARPQDISVGVCWQYMPGVEPESLDVGPFRDRVRVAGVDARESRGVCWARQRVEQFFGGEDHTLQLDSHMRFVPGWDELMRTELARCADPKAVLSCNPPAYLPPDQLEPNPRPMVKRAAPLEPPGDIRCRAEFLDFYPEAPVLSAFVSCAFVFARGDLLREVPTDPWLYFNQEEITYSMRLYTHGWNVYCPSRVLVYHLYYDGSTATPTRPQHWRDFSGWGAYQKIGKARFDHLSKYAVSTDPTVLVDLDNYSLGSVRSLEEYEAFGGVDFRKKIVTEHGLQLRFVPGIERLRRNPVRVRPVRLADNGRKQQVT
jgi:Glycosyltransferase (GlcNAc)